MDAGRHKTYWYRVRAFAGSATSPYSNVVKTTSN
jgi:hypothetical protein